MYLSIEKVSFTLSSFSQNHICGEVELEPGKNWFFIGAYGWHVTENKHKTWALLRRLCSEYDGPILIGGDFNEILNYEEKEGGTDSEKRAIPEFREMVEDCDMRDLGYEGSWYTWERGMTTLTRVREKLDHFLGNTSWCAQYPEASVTHMVRFKSDHTPILVHWGY